MAQAIKLSDGLLNDAAIQARAHHRSTPKQIEYWSRMGKLAEENPDLTLGFIKDMLVGIEEKKAGELSDYKFG